MMSALVNNENWSFGDRVDALLSQADHDREQDPDMGENAAMMVLVGDVYVLREETVIVEDSWGSKHYTADISSDPM